MSQKIDIAEVDAFSNDLEEVSSNVRSSIDKVQERVDAVNNMESFSGKAAKEAKSYFNELHLTILESFRGLFDDLNENLNQHIKSFGTEVDASESAIIESNYLQDVKEDINEVFASLKEQQESINETIGDVSDISSATSPDFSDVQEWKKKSVKKIKEVDEDLGAFTSKGNEVDVNEIMHQIEAVMSKATTSKGKARFAEFNGASDNSELAKLMEYNDEKQHERNKEIEKAKDIRNNALQDQIKHSSRDVINQAFEDYKNGEIEYDQYVAILGQVEKTSSNMNEKQLEEQTTASFLAYLDDNDLLDKYLADHQPFVEYVVDKMPSMVWEHGEGYIPVFIKNAGKSHRKLADYLMEQEKEIIKATKIADLDVYRDIKKEYKKADKLIKSSKYVGKALGWAGVGYGFYSDIKHEDKTVGEAVAHSGALLALGGTIALASNPGGWAIAAAVGATAIFEFAYSQNIGGLQDGLDKVGKKLSEWGEAATGVIMSHNPTMINPAIQFMSK